MIATLLKFSSFLDAWLREHFGRPYLGALGVGLVLGIIATFQELLKDLGRHDSVLKLSLFIAFQAALLVNQLAQFHDYREERQRQREAKALRRQALVATEPAAAEVAVRAGASPIASQADGPS